MSKGYCAVPFVEGFCASNGGFRNCCVTNPPLRSEKDQDFRNWWYGETMEKFRAGFHDDLLPIDCEGCKISEKVYGTSLRTTVNKEIKQVFLKPIWPSRWHLTFGNLCNLGCWTCNENASSIIETDKKKLQLIPIEFDNRGSHEKMWQKLQDHVLESYKVHPGIINLTIQGGEPLYNKNVIDFLNKLNVSGLSRRTRLEFHTNGTQFPKKIQEIFSTGTWAYVCMFISIDAVGKKAEWLRYGSKWSKIQDNIQKIKKMVDFIEIHATLSIMNLRDLPRVKQWTEEVGLPLKVNLVNNPWFMSITKWDRSPGLIADQEMMYASGFGEFYEKIGTEKVAGSSDTLSDYIKKFDTIRRPLRNYDPILADVLGL